MAHLQAKKSLGQHFLHDEKTLRDIAEAARIPEDEIVIEIGPGTGNLTRRLLKQRLSKLIAFELDDRAIEVLNTDLPDPRLEVVHQDFMSVVLNTFLEGHEKLTIVGNIPYYITSPIIFKLLDERACIRSATLLVQLEVAERLAGVPRTKAYGIPSVISQCFANVEMLFKVKATAFRPPPRVESAVVRLDFENNYFQRSGAQPPPNFDEKRFSKLVRTLFAMRRKMIRNNLKQLQDIHFSEVEPSITGFLTKRAEELSVADFLELYGLLYGASQS